MNTLAPGQVVPVPLRDIHKNRSKARKIVLAASKRVRAFQAAGLRLSNAQEAYYRGVGVLR